MRNSLQLHLPREREPNPLPRRSLNPPATLHPAHGIIIATPANGAIIATVPLLRGRTDSKASANNKKGEPSSSPFLLICCVASEAALTARMFSSDAHRKSGVFSDRAALSPVESYSPPELRELTLRLYA